MKHYLSFCLLLTLTSVSGQFQTKMQIEYSKAIGDSFEIYISLPSAYNSNDTCNVFYYCDANLKSGEHLRDIISSIHSDNQQKTIFVGIGHIGNYHALRRRDFILPTIITGDTIRQRKNYGQIDKFYSYLKNELIPSINSRFRTNPDSNSVLGHSLGGLFTFFCLFKADNLFSKYFALSPALWVNRYSIYKFNKIQDVGFVQRKYLYFAAGSKETINRILKGTNQAKQFLDEKQYRNLVYDYDVWQGKTHNSEVPLSLEKILKEKL